MGQCELKVFIIKLSCSVDMYIGLNWINNILDLYGNIFYFLI